MSVRSTTLPISWRKNTAAASSFRWQTSILKILFPPNENIEAFEIISPSSSCICWRGIIFKNVLMLYCRINKYNNFFARLFVKDSSSAIVSNGAVKPGYFSNYLPRIFVRKQNWWKFGQRNVTRKKHVSIVFVAATLHKLELNYIFGNGKLLLRKRGKVCSR